MAEGKIATGSIYIYAPNKGAAVFFSIAFLAVGTWHLWRCRQYKSWKVTGLQPLSCFMFAVGFMLREYGAFHYTDTTLNLNIYIASTCLIYMAPPLLELANFHILGRILYYVPYCAPMHPGRILTTFSILSALVEALNAIGVVYLSNRSLPQSLVTLGQSLMKAGLCLQLAVIVLFLALSAGVFHRRCAHLGLLSKSRNLRIPLLVLYVSTTLVLIRTVYRVVEYFTLATLESEVTDSSSGTATTISPLLRYEWFFYVFEASVMLGNVVLWAWFHPRRYLPASELVMLEKDGVTEVEGPGWEDDRNWLMTTIDPCGCLNRKKAGYR